MEGIVFAADTCSIVDPATGLKVRLVAGEAWAADDPLVSAVPHMFISYPQLVRRTTDPVRNPQFVPVESAVSQPGVKRTVKRAEK